MSGNFPWYVARASGLVGWGLLAAATLWGLALSTKVLGKRPRPNWILDLHRWLGGVALILTRGHAAAGPAQRARTATGHGRPLGGARVPAGNLTPPSGRVLIVEDDQSVRDAIARALRYEGYDVRTAIDGDDGLAHVVEDDPDV